MNYWMLDYGKWTPEMIATAHLHDLVPCHVARAVSPSFLCR